MSLNRWAFFSTAVIFLSSCAAQKTITVPYQDINNEIKTAFSKSQHHIGFVIKQAGATENMVEINADHYFTPASNIKLFTFYTALNILGDSVPSFQYAVKNDSLIIWPMADATFLHPDFKTQKSFDFLKKSGKSIYLVNGRYKGDKFGKGWAWDDYNDDYQSEITDFPLYGNNITVTANSQNYQYSPDLPALYMSDISTSDRNKTIKREIFSNNLVVPKIVENNLVQLVPMHLNNGIIENLLTDTLLASGMVIKPVVSLPWRNVYSSAKVYYSTPSDSVYKYFLQNSDNFIAEELLLTCAAIKGLSFRTDSMIAYSIRTFMRDLPNDVKWIDGSGLSRYNLASPKDFVEVLDKIRSKVDDDSKLFSLLPAGGNAGLLKSMFPGTESYVFAKSGSLSNNFNLSGYLIGKSGKKYIFSFMNNNFLNDFSEIKNQVAEVITFIHNNY